MNRRRFLGAAAAYLSVPQLATRPREQRARMRLVMLGTAGGPRPRATRSAPAQAIVVDGAAYVVDCGDGVARQLVLAGVPLSSVRDIRVTAALVHHPPMAPAFAYRFDAPDRSIVISGDTTPTERLVALARNADVLVHEGSRRRNVGALAPHPGRGPGITDEMWSTAARKHFSGRIVVAKDLMEL